MRLPALKLTLTLACATVLSALHAQAQTPSNSTEKSPLWEVHVDLQKSFASPLGKWVLTMIEKENPKDIQDLAKLAEAIGIDLRTDIGEVVLFGNGFEETDATLIAQLGQSTGNLEGWILAAPGYQSKDLDNNTLLHSIIDEDKKARIWFALPKNPQSGVYVLIGSFDENRTVELAKKVLAGNPSSIPNPLHGNTLLSFYVNDLSAVPLEIDETDPGSGIVKIIEQFNLNVTSDENNLGVALNLSASSAGKARQISQLLTGLKALMQLAPQDDPEGQKLAILLESLVIEQRQGQPNVKASLSAPYRLFEDFLSVLEYSSTSSDNAYGESYGN